PPARNRRRPVPHHRQDPRPASRPQPHPRRQRPLPLHHLPRPHPRRPRLPIRHHRRPPPARRRHPPPPTGHPHPRPAPPDPSPAERAALTPDRLAQIGAQHPQEIRRLVDTLLRVQSYISIVDAHAPDDDPTPVGTGPCTIRTCDHTCLPRRNPDDRLRSGLCPACYAAFRRWLKDNPDGTILEWRPIRTAALRPRPIAS